MPKPRIWLIAALAEVDRQYYRLKIEGNDFEQPDSEWEPLTLDRADPLVENMTARVSEVYEQVRADNGYAHSNPEERQYVLSALESTLKRLQQATSISIGYLNKNVREPLSQLGRRFGKASLGIAVQAASEAVKQWLKSKGITFLDSLL